MTTTARSLVTTHACFDRVVAASRASLTGVRPATRSTGAPMPLFTPAARGLLRRTGPSRGRVIGFGNRRIGFVINRARLADRDLDPIIA